MTWDDVIERHGAALLLFARQWTPCVADAEDALQDAVLRAYRARPDARGREILPLVYQAIKWAAMDQARRRTRRVARETSAADETPLAIWFECPVERAERCADVESALKRLPEDQRDVLVLRIWGRLTFRQIAATLDIPIGTGVSRYHYGLRALRSALTPAGELCREPV